jgi:Fe-S-cluster-containing dehydrogenase component/DMSO reductase anchor subunit
MTRYAMVADLERCVGCQTCTAACRHANATSPSVQWRRVLDIESGAYPEVSRTFVPVGCQHCADPPCMHVCPTTATRKRADGIVTVDYDLCIGCAYCDVACPYQARFKVDRKAFAFGAAMPSEQASADERRLGVSQKCTFCGDRIDYGLANGLVPGSDPRATPACVNSCIADALHFGDLDDPQSGVSRLLAGNTGFRMHEELGTEPRFYYLHDHRHAGPPKPLRPDAPVRGEGIEPRHQPHWDWKAAANFLSGGSGAALFALAVGVGVPGAAAAALGLMALGLLVLFFKIGRPLRFLYVLRQPQRSWMSREAWLAGFLFPAGILYLLTASAWLGAVAAALALGFLFAQAMILKEAKGIPAWRTPRIVPLVLTTGLAEGAGLLALFLLAPPASLAVLLAALLAVRGWAWRDYFLALEREGAPARTLEVLRGCRGWMLWGGLVLPIALIAIGLAPLGGLAAVASGWTLKFVLVTRAAYQQGFALERGGTTLKPGWTLGRKAS